MDRLRLSILSTVAILALGLTTYLVLAREGHPGHASGSPALDGQPAQMQTDLPAKLVALALPNQNIGERQ